MRKEACFAVIGVLLIWIQFGCRPNEYSSTPIKNGTSRTGGDVAPADRTFLMGTFNIQSLGVAKLAKTDVMEVLTDIVRRFDLIAIQELRSEEQHIIPTFLDMLNANGMNYKAEVSERIGKGRYYEQFVYIYDADKLQVTRDSFVAPDRYQIMHRSLYVTSFRCIESSSRPFTFTLFNVHVDPDEIATEVPALSGIVQNVVEQMPEEDDFIVLGDFNAQSTKLAASPFLRNQVAIVPDGLATNTAGNKSIDNITLDYQSTLEYRGNGGVMDFMTEYGLTQQQAALVSDHMPVWAEFSIYETEPASIASPRRPEIRR